MRDFFYLPATRGKKVGFVYSTAPGHLDHKGGHLENIDRVTGIPRTLQRSRLLGKLDVIAVDRDSLNHILGAKEQEEWIPPAIPMPLPPNLLDISYKLRVHTKKHRNFIQKECKSLSEDQNKGDDTYLCSKTEMHALSNIACCRMMLERILDQKDNLETAFAAIRPPGHHAWSNKSHGFCIYNTAAALAKHAIQRGKRPFVLDVDFHMGDGTYDILKKDPHCFFMSVHRFGKNKDGEDVFPACGDESEVGEGPGEGTCLNVPLRCTENRERDAEYMYILISMILPVIQAWAPDVIILSNGFDCIAGDAIAEANGGMDLTPSFFGKLIHALRKIQPKLIAVLEGGYVPETINQGVCEAVKAMTRDASNFIPQVPISIENSFRAGIDGIWRKWFSALFEGEETSSVLEARWAVINQIRQKASFTNLKEKRGDKRSLEGSPIPKTTPAALCRSLDEFYALEHETEYTLQDSRIPSPLTHSSSDESKDEFYPTQKNKNRKRDTSPSKVRREESFEAVELLMASSAKRRAEIAGVSSTKDNKMMVKRARLYFPQIVS
mmetsp:Transcript_19037/g.26562  ORF Transcript_19037/g.26562 Transcript_19037/m.26562 type:complete len:552 (-) Transcript_19037:328-1983(-)|eukprot:CAMPEP_0184488612 /NCGR_PEP_ID=MMETSP0113_2-20130426/12704_1 /TAXON_ID=91329 /ORGANISM="Norrisiella sphaerica, Strain BC52" /LENGTH=551 /DNA_ID=CAMNT_0026871513 /DNA_START=53 /DNA_END=1708 /DNA_ORIENTATION=-